MKVVDIADEIFRELNSPSALSIPAIAFWLKTNVGTLNNFISTTHSVNATTNEFQDEDKNSVQEDEKVIFKKMYMIHYYDLKIRENIISVSTDTVISVTDDNSSVTKINKNEVSKMLTQLKRQEYNELQKLVTAYKINKAGPKQVAGDDTETILVKQTNTRFNRINN